MERKVIFLLQLLSGERVSMHLPVFSLLTGLKDHARGDMHRLVLNAYHVLSLERTWETEKELNYS